MKETIEMSQDRLVTLTDDELRAFEADESNRVTLRDYALGILSAREAERQSAHQAQLAEAEAKAQAEVQQRQADREAARAVVDETPAQPKGEPEASSANHAAAIRFNQRLAAAGLHTGVMQTEAVQGRRVRDGWMVNVHDTDLEIGFVACWWGRGHFTAFAEVAGHRDRTDEAADLMLALLHRAREHEQESGE